MNEKRKKKKKKKRRRKKANYMSQIMWWNIDFLKYETYYPFS